MKIFHEYSWKTDLQYTYISSEKSHTRDNVSRNKPRKKCILGFVYFTSHSDNSYSVNALFDFSTICVVFYFRHLLVIRNWENIHVSLYVDVCNK